MAKRRKHNIRKLYPREESSYRNMMTRCFNEKATGYEYYGGRGITVCQHWVDDFYNFYKDMGPRPDNCSIDRVDNNKDYTPTNCRWATHTEQSHNSSASTSITYEGVTLVIKEWAELIGVKPNTLVYRLRRGWELDRALTTSPQAERSKKNA